MRRPWRARLSAAARSELWRRWRQGESLCAIGRALDRFSTTLNREVRSRGGFPPPERKRSLRQLCLGEREEISRGLGAGHTLTRIAAQLGRSVSTVCLRSRATAGRAPMGPLWQTPAHGIGRRVSTSTQCSEPSSHNGRSAPAAASRRPSRLTCDMPQHTPFGFSTRIRWSELPCR